VKRATVVLVLGLVFSPAGAARADVDGGPVGDAENPADAATPVACGGALCATSDDTTCSSSTRPGHAGSGVSLVLLGAVLALALARRRLRLLLSGLLILGTATTAEAAEEGAVDVVVHDSPPSHRVLLVEWNPLPLFTIHKLSANFVFTPREHHALVLSPFYAWSKTEPVYAFDDAGNATQLPEQRFHGFGTELGYRYYRSHGGPRGLFVGPSLVLGSFTARAQSGQTTDYLQYGVAADVGYQIILAERIALSLGGGVQYLTTSKSIPDQQFPSWIYANRRVSPRVLMSLGWAF